MATALITGASSGIGEEFAYALAREKYDLALVARRGDRLKTVGQKARGLGAAKIRTIAADLSRRDAAAMIFRELEKDGVSVDYLVNNAGFGTRGRFYRMPLARELEEIDVNVTALVALTHLFAPAMAERRRGTIINVASTAAFQPIPFMATYAATKAFVVSFTSALAVELENTGVTAMALCPGPVRTEFQIVAGTEDTRVPSLAFLDASTVVAQALAAAKRGKTIHIAGAFNQMMTGAARFAPRSLVTRIAAGIHRPDSD